MSEETLVIVVLVGILIIMLLLIIIACRKQDDYTILIAKAQIQQAKRKKEQRYNELEQYFGKQIKLHGEMIRTNFSIENAIIVSSGTINMTEPVLIGNIEDVQKSKLFLNKHIPYDYVEAEGILTGAEKEGERAVKFELVSVRKLTKKERNSFQLIVYKRILPY